MESSSALIIFVEITLSKIMFCTQYLYVLDNRLTTLRPRFNVVKVYIVSCNGNTTEVTFVAVSD